MSTNCIKIFSRVLRDFISHFLVAPLVPWSVGRSVTKLFKRRFTQNKDISNVFECFYGFCKPLLAIFWLVS